MENEELYFIGATFLPTKELKNKKLKLCRIKFRGDFITTVTGKTIWKAKSHAKSALLHHFECVAKDLKFLKRGIYGLVDKESIKKLIRELENSNIIEYIEFDGSGI